MQTTRKEKMKTYNVKIYKTVLLFNYSVKARSEKEARVIAESDPHLDMNDECYNANNDISYETIVEEIL